MEAGVSDVRRGPLLLLGWGEGWRHGGRGVRHDLQPHLLRGVRKGEECHGVRLDRQPRPRA